MPSTFSNDLRIEEQASGENSGTWGNKVNSAFSQIAEAFSYGTQDCFSSDADATTTVADGATDPARAMYFKVTSSATLTATRTLTIAPNTISRVMFIENATTGSQSIAISQGSGANVTIGTGKAKVVYLDGAGSGAAVVDAMAKVDPGVNDTLAEILAAGNATGGTDIAVGTGDDITFADSSKAIFGAGSDLQIYHDGSQSIIRDAGTGNFFLRGENIYVQNSDGSANYLAGVGNEASLYYIGDKKLATTNTGIDVTGSVVSDGLTVNTGTTDVVADFVSSDANAWIQIKDSSTTDTAVMVGAVGDDMRLRAGSNERVRVTSTGNVGIGTSSPTDYNSKADDLVVLTSGDTGISIVSGTSNEGALAFADGTSASAEIMGRVRYDHSSNEMDFRVNNAEAMRIDSSGNVGVGTTSTTSIRLQAVTSTANHVAAQIENSNTADSFGLVVKGGNDANDYTADFRKRDNTNIMRIRGDGNVGIGLSTGISSKLHVNTEISIGADGDNRAIVGYTPSRFYIGTRQSGTNYFDTVNVSGGNVGIGTSSPAVQLSLKEAGSTSAVNEFVRIENNAAGGAGAGSSINFNHYHAGGGPAGGAKAASITAQNMDSWAAGTPSSYSSGLTFGTRHEDSFAERMRLDSSGNVGIGTSSPAYKTQISDSGDTVLSVVSGDSNSASLYLGDSVATRGRLTYDNSNDSLAVYTDNNERMRIDSKGMLGLGSTPPTDAHATWSQFFIGEKGSVFSEKLGSGGIYGLWLTDNDYIDADTGSHAYRTTDEASAINLEAGTTIFNRAASGTAGAALTWSESMRIDSSGNVGIGISPSSKLDINISTNARGYFADNIGEVTSGTFCLQVVDSANTALKPLGFRAEDIRFATGSNERMRLDASGNLLVGRSNLITFGSNTTDGIVLYPNRLDVSAASLARITQVRDSTGTLDRFYNGTSIVGSITCTTSATAFNTSSDQRLKSNIVDAPSASDDIDAIQVRSFDWKADGSHQKYGMVAQELVTVAPSAVSQPEDPEEMMGVDYSKLVPMLIKEVQQLRARVAQLEGEN